MSTPDDSFFREMTLRMCGTLDINVALKNAFQYLKHYVPLDAMGLGYVDIASGRMHVLAKAARSGARYPWDASRDDIEVFDDYLEFIRDIPKEPPAVIVNRPDERPEAALETFPGLMHSSLIILRLNVGGEWIGALCLSAEGHDRYRAEHAHLLDSICEPFAIAMVNARRHDELARAHDVLKEDNLALTADLKRDMGVEIVGADFGLKEVMDLVRQIAPSRSPTLLLGETGTGKEVIAAALHMASPRSSGPLIAMQCGATPETLLDSELFGHEKGAFTGALDQKRGRFERADGGTLFLDEVGELTAEAQIKLLRVIQEQRFERIGGTKTIEVDVRVVAATHRDLEQMVREGRFREDLWYRLNVLPIRIPPLRLRREDIPSLVQHLVERKVCELNLPNIPLVPDRALESLMQYDWPGNIRELQNIVERALLLCKGDILEFPEFCSTSRRVAKDSSRSATKETFLTLDDAVAAHIRTALALVNGQVAGPGGAAELLQVNPSTLRFRMKKLGISPSLKQ